MYGPSDSYGDLTCEDVEEFEGLQPDDERAIDPLGRFQRNEVRSFERDFEYDLELSLWEQSYEDEEFDMDKDAELFDTPREAE